MIKLKIGMVVLAALLSGCGGGDVKEPLVPTAKIEPIFEPGAGLLPLPNDILFGGSLDLTLNIPADDPTDFSDPKVALSGLDGWSAVAPFAISFRTTDATLDLNPATVIPGASVRMFQVNLLRSEVAPGVIAPTGPVIGIDHELVPGVEFFATYSAKNTVAIIPLKPLTAQASYVVVVTDAISDSNGNAIQADGQYVIAKGTTPITSALEPIRQLTSQLESVMAAAGVNRSSIVLSMQFTVQSIGNTIAATKGFYIDFPLLLGAVPQTSFSSLFTDTTPFTGLGAADLYKGQFTLNYYLGAPSQTNPTAPLNVFWKTAAMVPDGQGGLVANPNPGGNLSYANPLPEMNSQETVPLLVSMPKASLGCAKPAAGYPVTIFQHGITANRTNLIGIADSLAAPPTCTAAVAMDMPLHGIDANNPLHLGLQQATGGLIGLFEDYTAGGLRERTLGLDFVDNATGAPGPDGTPDASGTHTINLSNLLVARDNNRQAIVDLLALEKAIPFMDVDGGGADFDVSNVSYIGHSLGGIVGSSFVAYSDNVKAAALANPGGGTALMLNGSQSFGPRIRAGIAGAAGLDPSDPAFAPVLAQFLFVAQTVLDASDPLNTAVFALANDVPTLMLQNLNDAVVPNAVAGAPLSGTMPLAATLELQTTVATDPGFVAGSRLFTKLNQGLHSTVLTPSDGVDPVGLLNVTTEMQTQIVSFLSTGGAGVLVTDPALMLEPTP